MKQSKKICLIYNFPPHYRKAIFKKLDDNLNIDFYFGDYLDWAPDIKKMDLKELKGFKKELKNIRFLKIFIWQKGVLNSIINKGYTHVILYGDSFYFSNWFIMIYCRLFKIKTAIWTHGLNLDPKGLSGLYNRAFYSLTNFTLLYGNYAKIKMIENRFNPDKLLVIYNSLDYEKQLEIRNKLTESAVYWDHFGNSKPVLLYIGRVQKIKKLESILRALSKLKSTEYEFNFVIIGEDKDGVNLEELVIEMHLQENVWFYGACYDEKMIGNLLFNATVCVSPGNIGLTSMHSLVYGTPVITHNNFQNQGPEFEAIKAGLTGDFFQENDIDSLVEKIIIWVEKSKLERKTIRLNCYETIDTFYNPNYQFNVIDSI